MTEEKQHKSPSYHTWDEVGQQFRMLGESLASAFKATWENEETQQNVEKMKAGVEAMAAEISEAVKGAAASEEGQKIKSEAKKAGEEIRPHLVAAFRKMRNELDRMIETMEKSDSETPPTGSEPTEE